MEITRSGQNLLDIAIQTTGDASTALALALTNGLCLTDDLAVDFVINVPDDIGTDENIKSYYSARGYKPATGVTKTDETMAPFEGIEYWGIEYDFIVS